MEALDFLLKTQFVLIYLVLDLLKHILISFNFKVECHHCLVNFPEMYERLFYPLLKKKAWC